MQLTGGREVVRPVQLPLARAHCVYLRPGLIVHIVGSLRSKYC